MECPRCGYDMQNKSKCLRCGYEVKTLATVDNADEKKSQDNAEEEKIETKVIDPCNVYLTHPYGVDDDDMYAGFGGGFGSIFDMLFGDPISDLLGGIFGVDMGGSRRSSGRAQQEDPPKKKRKQGPIVDVSADEVEVLDENDNPVDKKHTATNSSAHSSQSAHGGAEHKKTKNPFRRNNKRK